MHLGQPVTITARVVAYAKGKAPDKEPVSRGPMADYRVAFAIYTPVLLADYPFPTRPAALVSLDEGALSGEGRRLRTVSARDVGATGATGVRFRLPRQGAVVDLYAVEPGTLRVAVNGTTVSEWSSWTYTGGGFGSIDVSAKGLRPYGVTVRPGQTVTVTITATRFTDPAWRAVVAAAS
ncbi:MAG: hypothetical protein ACXV4A_14365 [Actinomycetes bacterium]